MLYQQRLKTLTSVYFVSMAALQVSMTPISAGQDTAPNRSTLYTQLRAALLENRAQTQAALPDFGNLQAESAPELHRQGVHFSRWMYQNTRQSDHITVQMDIAGAESDVVEQLVADGSILLIDNLNIIWHEKLQPEKLEWVRIVQQTLEKLGVQHAPHIGVKTVQQQH